jgi:hypothetical protein
VDDSQSTQTAKRRDRLGHLRAALEDLKCGHLFDAVVDDLRAEGAQLGARVRQPGEAWMGRPTKCTPELTRQIAAYIRAGGFPWVSAQACGISTRTCSGSEHHLRSNLATSSRLGRSFPHYPAYFMRGGAVRRAT